MNRQGRLKSERRSHGDSQGRHGSFYGSTIVKPGSPHGGFRIHIPRTTSSGRGSVRLILCGILLAVLQGAGNFITTTANGQINADPLTTNRGALSAATEAHTEKDDFEIEITLQLTWRATQPRPWDVTIATNHSQGDPRAILDHVTNLCEHASSPLEFSRSPDATSVSYRSTQLRAEGRCTLRVRGDLNSELTVSVQPIESEQATATETLLLKDLLTTPFVSEAKQGSMQWSLGRVSDDLFRLSSSAASWPLVDADAAINLHTKIQFYGRAASTTVLLNYQLKRVRDGHIEAEQQTEVRLDEQGTCERILIDDVAPTERGVYEILVQLIERPETA